MGEYKKRIFLIIVLANIIIGGLVLLGKLFLIKWVLGWLI